MYAGIYNDKVRGRKTVLLISENKDHVELMVTQINQGQAENNRFEVVEFQDSDLYPF